MASDVVVNGSEREVTVGLGCAPEMFSELEEVLNIIENLRIIYSSEMSVERAYERFTYIMNPHLLDPHLNNILEKLICIIRCRDASIELKHATFKYLYMIMKVRGYKVVVRHVPHEVSDIEPVLQLQEIQNPSDNATWQTRYVLLSIIVIIPLNISRLDSFKPEDPGNESRKTVMERILSACKIYALSSDLFHVAAFLSSCFLTRSHVKELHLAAFLDWACNWIVSSDSPVFAQCGSLASIAAILKHGEREDLLPHGQSLLKWILASKYRQKPNTLVRKFGVKVIQRIGLIFLKMDPQRGGRSLAANLVAGDSIAPEPPPLSLAADGTSRLLEEFPEVAEDVLPSILQLFTPPESDGEWRRRCIVFAELGRMGVLQQQLHEVVPIILEALECDEPDLVGTNTRDAASYACFALAGAYEPDALQEFVESIVSALMSMLVFDRETDCRRAALGALRWYNEKGDGTMREDYYLMLCPHWRELMLPAGAMLSSTSGKENLVEVGRLVPRLRHQQCPLFDYACRYIIRKCSAAIMPFVDEEIKGTILDDGDVVPRLRHEEFPGMDGELMEQACSYIIEKCSAAMMPFLNEEVSDHWQTFLEECLSDEVDNVRQQAVSVLSAMFTEYCPLKLESGEHLRARCKKVVTSYAEQVTSIKRRTRMGYALAIGSFPKFMFDEHLDIVIPAVIQCSKFTETTGKWAESRRDALGALASICLTVSRSKNLEPETLPVEQIYDCFLEGLTDYTICSRADIGACVREAAMSGLQVLLLRGVRPNCSSLTSGRVTDVMVGVAQRCGG